jgi:uncharacterized damage-inducible protein DinB
MIQRQPWFEWSFPSGLPAHLLPVVIERLRGTAARLTDRLSGVAQDALVRKDDGTWSIQENVGHLQDLEALWLRRANDLAARHSELTVADLTNRKTHEANHNVSQLEDLLADFRRARGDLVGRLESFSIENAAATARHPRMGTPMNIVDLAYFVAEHDDYHLAQITELLGRASKGRVGCVRARTRDRNQDASTNSP